MTIIDTWASTRPGVLADALPAIGWPAVPLTFALRDADGNKPEIVEE